MYREVLKTEATDLFEKIKKFDSLSDFYLAGGTGLALQIGHRISVDFDFFSSNEIKKNFLDKVEQFVGSRLEVLVKSKDELTLLINDVKVSFIYYPFELIFPLENFSIIKFASVKEIALMKAYALGRRQSFKDYVDLYKIITLNLSTLNEIINGCKLKYKHLFNDRVFLEQLIYIDDIIDEPIQWLDYNFSRETVLTFFEAEVKKYLNNELK